jgi:hypothetical protein
VRQFKSSSWAAESVGRTDYRDHPILDPVAEQAGQCEMSEVVGAHMGFESICRACQRQAQHAGVVDQHVNAVHRVGELSHAGQIGQIEVRYRNVAGHRGGGPLGFPDGAAGDHDAVTGGRECRGGRLADAAVAARDNNFHPAII